MRFRHFAVVLVAAFASHAFAQDCAAQRGEWLKQHHKCLKLFKEAVAEDKQPKSGLFEPQLDAFISCFDEEKNRFPQFIAKDGECKDFVPAKLEKNFEEFTKACFNRSNMDKCGEMLKDKKIDNIRNAEGATLLMMAAKECDLKAFNYLLSQGADVKRWDHRGRGIMHYALQHEYLDAEEGSDEAELNSDLAQNQDEIIRQLIEKGALVNDIALDGAMPLGYAFGVTNRQNVVKTLLAAGAKPALAFFKPRGKSQISVLSDVIISQGSTDKLKDILETGVNPNDVAYAAVPLWGLVWSNKEIPVGDTMAVMLLQAGLDPNGYINMDKTQSVFADVIRAESPIFVIQAFLKAKVDLNNLIWDGEHFDPMRVAIEKGNVGIVQALLQAGYDPKTNVATLKNGGKINALEFAIVYKNKEIVDLLLKKKPDVNRKIRRDDGTITNPLCLAAYQEGNAAVVKSLIAAKANVNQNCGSDDSTPLTAAVDNSDEDMVRVLVNAKANVNVVREGGFTLLEFAQYKENSNIINMLKKAGARAPFRGDFVGFCADSNLTEKMVLDAIRDGADVNEVKGDDGWTPLHAVALFGRDLKAMQVLIKKGAFVNAQTKSGMTPFLMAAKFNSNPAFAKMLMAAGADIDARDSENNGWDALQDAVANNGPEVVSLLLGAGMAQGYNEAEKNLLVRIAVRNNDNHRVLITLLKNGFHAEPTNSWWEKPLNVALEFAKPIDIIKVLISGGAIVDDSAMRKARDLPMETKEQQKYRNQVIDILTKAKKKKR